jgi:hypothetical protein
MPFNCPITELQNRCNFVGVFCVSAVIWLSFMWWKFRELDDTYPSVGLAFEDRGVQSQ